MTKQISPLRQRMLDDMAFRNMSASTQQCDTYAVACFARYHRPLPREAEVVVPGAAEKQRIGGLRTDRDARVSQDEIGELGEAVQSDGIGTVDPDVLIRLRKLFANGLQVALLQLDVSQIIVDEGDEPNALVDLCDAYPARCVRLAPDGRCRT